MKAFGKALSGPSSGCCGLCGGKQHPQHLFALQTDLQFLMQLEQELEVMHTRMDSEEVKMNPAALIMRHKWRVGAFKTAKRLKRKPRKRDELTKLKKVSARALPPSAARL